MKNYDELNKPTLKGDYKVKRNGDDSVYEDVMYFDGERFMEYQLGYFGWFYFDDGSKDASVISILEYLESDKEGKYE